VVRYFERGDESWKEKWGEKVYKCVVSLFLKHDKKRREVERVTTFPNPLLSLSPYPPPFYLTFQSHKRFNQSSSPFQFYTPSEVTMPAATVCPPSRMANRIPFQNTPGTVNSTLMAQLSPGMASSFSTGKQILPAMSAVFKKN